MKYLVDPQLITAILDVKSKLSKRITAWLEEHRTDEILLAPTSYIALSPAFMGNQATQDRFLSNLGIKVAKQASAKVMDDAYAVWNRFQEETTRVKGGGFVFDQLYIGAFALQYDGLLTRHGDLYRRYFKDLNVIEP